MTGREVLERFKLWLGTTLAHLSEELNAKHDHLFIDAEHAGLWAHKSALTRVLEKLNRLEGKEATTLDNTMNI